MLLPLPCQRQTKKEKNNVHTDRNENYPSRFNWQQLFCKRRHDLPFIHCSLQVNMDNEHSDDCKQLYSRKYVFCNSSNLTFARSAYLSPKCYNLEPSRPSAFKSLNRIADTDCAFLSDVKGDGRCGYRALAKAVGVSYRCIMQTLVDLMIRSPKEFTAANVLQMIMAMDENNACPRSCWLSGAHIALLSQFKAWFRNGIVVRNFDRSQLEKFIFFHDGQASQHSCFPVHAGKACIIGLIARPTPHFVLLTSCPSCVSSSCLETPTVKHTRVIEEALLSVPDGDTAPHTGVPHALPEPTTVVGDDTPRKASWDSCDILIRDKIVTFLFTPADILRLAAVSYNIFQAITDRRLWQGHQFFLPKCSCAGICTNCLLRVLFHHHATVGKRTSVPMIQSFLDFFPSPTIESQRPRYSFQPVSVMSGHEDFSLSLWYSDARYWNVPPMFSVKLCLPPVLTAMKDATILLGMGSGQTGADLAQDLIGDQADKFIAIELQLQSGLCKACRLITSNRSLTDWMLLPKSLDFNATKKTFTFLLDIPSTECRLAVDTNPCAWFRVPSLSQAYMQQWQTQMCVFRSTCCNIPPPSSSFLNGAVQLVRPHAGEGLFLMNYENLLDIAASNAVVQGGGANIWLPAVALTGEVFGDGTQRSDTCVYLPEEGSLFKVESALSGNMLWSFWVSFLPTESKALQTILQEKITQNTMTSVFRSRFVLDEKSWYEQDGRAFLKSICVIRVCFLAEQFSFQEQLLEALRERHFPRVQHILFSGQSPNFLDSSGASPLEIALAQEDERSAVALLQARADVTFEVHTRSMTTFLHMACHQDLPTAVSQLVHYRANVNALDVDGDDPLAVAVISGHLNCVKILMGHVPTERLAIRDRDGDSLITLACSDPMNSAVVSLLMSAHWPNSPLDPYLMILPRMRSLGVLSPAFFASCSAFNAQKPYYLKTSTQFIQGGASNACNVASFLFVLDLLCIAHIFARFNVWMASTASPRVSTVRLALSSIYTAISRNTNTSVFRSRFVLNKDLPMRFSLVVGGATFCATCLGSLDCLSLLAVLEFACDIATLKQLYATCHGMTRLVTDPHSIGQFRLPLNSCRCEKLCLNQCLQALAAQDFPLQRQLRSTHTLPTTHHCWHPSRSRCRRFNIWMAAQCSPQVSTVRLALSSLYTNKPVVKLYLGITDAHNPDTLINALVNGRVANCVFFGLELEIRFGHCAFNRWFSHQGRTQWQLNRHLDFRSDQWLTWLSSIAKASVFAFQHRRVSCLNLPTTWRINTAVQTKAFVAISCPEGETLPSPSMRNLGLVEPTMTVVNEARFLLQRLQVRSATEVQICGGAARVLRNDIPAQPAGGCKSSRPQSKRRPKANKIPSQPLQDHVPQKSSPKSALLIKPKWCNLIFSGTKTWEIRSQNTAKQERIAIAQAGSGTLIGEANLVNSFLVGLRDSHGKWHPPGNPNNFLWKPENQAKHCVPRPSELNYKKAYAWVLEDVKKYAQPKPYTHKRGCQKWVCLISGGSAQQSDHAEDTRSFVSTPHQVETWSVDARTESEWSEDEETVTRCNAYIRAVNHYTWMTQKSFICVSFIQAWAQAHHRTDAAHVFARLLMFDDHWPQFFCREDHARDPIPPKLAYLLLQETDTTSATLMWDIQTKEIFSFCAEGLTRVSFPQVSTSESKCIAYNIASKRFFAVASARELFLCAMPNMFELDAYWTTLYIIEFEANVKLLHPAEHIFLSLRTSRMEIMHSLLEEKGYLQSDICKSLSSTQSLLKSIALIQLCEGLGHSLPRGLVLFENGLLYRVNANKIMSITLQEAIGLLELDAPLFVRNEYDNMLRRGMFKMPSSHKWFGTSGPDAAHCRLYACFLLHKNVFPFLSTPSETTSLSVPSATGDAFTDESAHGLPSTLTGGAEQHEEQNLEPNPLASSVAGPSQNEPAQAAQSSEADIEMKDSDIDLMSLAFGTPEDFNIKFAEIHASSPARAAIVTKYLLADLVKFPVDKVKSNFPSIARMTEQLAAKAGCPFEWAFLFLPLLATACSKARLYINEFFLVPPLLWIGLCLDSGANKSGIMTALSEITSGFEKVLLQQAMDDIKDEPMEEETDMQMPAAHDDRNKKRKIAGDRERLALKANPPAIMSDEGSLPAIGMQMSQNSNRACGLYDEGRFLLKALANGEGSGFNASTMSKLFNGSHWKRQVVKDSNRFLCIRPVCASQCHATLKNGTNF